MGPVTGRPRGRHVVRIADVLEDVDLGEPEVLEDVPWRVVDIRPPPVDRIVGEAVDRLLEPHVRAVSVEELEELAA